MPYYQRKDTPIDINTIESQIDNVVISFFENYNINIYDLDQCRKVPHNTLNLCFREVYKQLFKPDRNMVNNQKSLIDYNNSELLQVLADKFVEICQRFNKSLGVMSFCYMTGIRYDTVYSWLNNPESNIERIKVIKSIQEDHKAQQIALLNDTPVGALAVANNDHETGLEWSKNNLQQIAANTVYLVPSEQSNRLALDKVPNE